MLQGCSWALASLTVQSDLEIRAVGNGILSGLSLTRTTSPKKLKQNTTTNRPEPSLELSIQGTPSLLLPQARADTSQGLISATQQLLLRLQSRHRAGSHAQLQFWASPCLVLLGFATTAPYLLCYLCHHTAVRRGKERMQTLPRSRYQLLWGSAGSSAQLPGEKEQQRLGGSCGR